MSYETRATDQLIDDVGTRIRVKGIVASTRILGSICFAVLKDAFGQIQVVLGGSILESVRRQSPPYMAEVVGIVQSRPVRDIRPAESNGNLEILAHDIVVLTNHTQHETIHQSRRALLEYLHARGFVDILALTDTLAPEALTGLDLADEGTGRFFSTLWAPCRWYQVTRELLYFGLTPGTPRDLERAVFSEGHGGNTVIADMLKEKARWNHGLQEDQAHLCSGSIQLECVPDGCANGVAFLRNRLGLTFLSDESLRSALSTGERGEAAQQSGESLLRGDTLLRTILQSAGNSRAFALARDFPQFAVQGKHVDQMVGMFSSLRRHLEAQTVEEQFNTLWSLLGHEHVKAIFASEQATSTLERAVALGLFSDYGILRVLTVSSLAAIVRLTNDFSDADALRTIKALGSRATSVFTSAVILMDRLNGRRADWFRCESIAARGVTSEIAFTALAMGVGPAEEVLRVTTEIARQFAWIFSNQPVTDADLLAGLSSGVRDAPWLTDVLGHIEPARAAFDSVHITFGDGLVDYEASFALFGAATDCCAHWHKAGIYFGGDRWNSQQSRLHMRGFSMYPSKNRAAILSKSCSGICSARDHELFHRTDHFQFTLVEHGKNRAAGSVQLYVCSDDNGKTVWIVRGLNPSEKSDLHLRPIEVTVEILDSIASLAAFNGVGAVLMADGAGLFNADSTRLPIRAVMRGMNTRLREVRLAVPLRIFDFHGKPIEIQRGWCVWP